jgi:predicted nuclease of predicted toxin-antitoxin system
VAGLWVAGHDVLWVKDSMAGAKDRDVLARAQAEARLVLTFDKDFSGCMARPQT